MASGTSLTLAFGVFLGAALLIASGLRNRSLGEVLGGQTSLLHEEAQTASESQVSSTGTGGGETGGAHGTRGAQKEFGDWLAKDTGLDRGVIEKWLLAEQPPGSPSKPGSNNWLNVQYTDSGPNATYYQIAKLSPRDAARATALWTAKNQPSILRARGRSPAEQEAAIVNSGWASSKYGGHL